MCYMPKLWLVSWFTHLKRSAQYVSSSVSTSTQKRVRWMCISYCRLCDLIRSSARRTLSGSCVYAQYWFCSCIYIVTPNGFSAEKKWCAKKFGEVLTHSRGEFYTVRPNGSCRVKILLRENFRWSTYRSEVVILHHLIFKSLRLS